MTACMSVRRSSWIVCFFFQAEDGIRDLTVTGVQTCALPIYTGRDVRKESYRPDTSSIKMLGEPIPTDSSGSWEKRARYEIGRASCRKECRSRWSPYH